MVTGTYTSRFLIIAAQGFPRTCLIAAANQSLIVDEQRQWLFDDRLRLRAS
jgi:hypothetical protein